MAGPSTRRQKEKKSTSKIFNSSPPYFSLSLSHTHTHLLSPLRRLHLSSFARKVPCAMAKRYRSKNSDGQSWYHDQYVPGKKRLDYAEGTM